MDDECLEELGRPISSLKVAELRDELTKRSLTRTGNKKELIDRLRIAIQRQSSLQSTEPESLTQQQQQQLQEAVHQQQLLQNPQYNVAMAIQQNQGAYQLNNAQSQAASYPVQQQFLQQPMIQQLDLQQQLEDYQNQLASAANYQQKQTFDSNVTQAPPPIDMRVPTQIQQSSAPQEKVTEQTLDYSSSEIKPEQLSNENNSYNQEMSSITNQSLETEACKADQPVDQKQPVDCVDGQTSSHVESETGIKSQSDSMIESNTSQEVCAEQSQIDKTSSEISKEEEESDNNLKQTQSSLEDVTETTTTQETDQGDREISHETSPQSHSDSKDGAPTETASRLDEKTENIPAKDCDIEISAQSSSISLKRGISQKSDSAGKEKRRKWSTKNPTDATITPVDSSQVPSESIPDKQSDESSKIAANEDQVSNEPSASVTQNSEAGMEEGQLVDSSIESKGSDNITQNEKNIDKESKTSDTDKKLNDKESTLPPKQEVESEPSNILLVQNLVRPFTLTQLKEVLTKHGPIEEDKFWTDKVKSKCCVMYESIEVAKLTKESLNGQQWPSSNPKTLKVSYTTEENLNNFLKIGLANANNRNRTFGTGENGGNINELIGKSITERLGQKLPETGDEPRGSDQVKRRLGDKITGDVGTKSSNVIREGDTSKPQELDDLFKKTKSVPHLFWLPLTESEADVRQNERDKREARAKELAKKRRSPPRRRSPIRHRSPMRHRSPVGRRSPIQNRSRSPIYRRSPMRPRSPMLRRSPMRRRSPPGRSSPPRRRSPGHVRRSPPHHRSPIRSPIPRSLGRSPPLRRSPGPIRRSPGPIRRSPGPMRRSPGQMRRSPGPMRRSPGPMRRSPGPIRRSPGLTRRSPITMRRSPQPMRRSPLPMRGNSPLLGRESPPRKRSPPRRQRTPPRHMSPGRTIGGYSSDQRRIERMDRLR